MYTCALTYRQQMLATALREAMKRIESPQMMEVGNRSISLALESKIDDSRAITATMVLGYRMRRLGGWAKTDTTESLGGRGKIRGLESLDGGD